MREHVVSPIRPEQARFAGDGTHNSLFCDVLRHFSRPQSGLKSFLQLTPRSRVELNSIARKRVKTEF